MFTDLFSSMDAISPMTTIWPVMILTFVIIFNKVWASTQLSSLNYLINTQVNANTPTPMRSLLLCLFLWFFSMNVMGLAPFIFGATTSIWIPAMAALGFWGILFLSGWQYSPKKAAASLVPAGAPGLLIPFLVIIETISTLIRPLTLTVRMIANISAGHIVLALISNCLCSLSFSVSALFLVGIGYNMFEVFVAFIQAYIFTLLISIYAQDHP